MILKVLKGGKITWMSRQTVWSLISFAPLSIYNRTPFTRTLFTHSTFIDVGHVLNDTSTRHETTLYQVVVDQRQVVENVIGWIYEANSMLQHTRIACCDIRRWCLQALFFYPYS